MNLKSVMWISAIIFIASFFRLWEIKTAPPGLWADEAVNGVNALQALEGAPPAGGWKIFYPENFGREGLFINIQALFVKTFGTEPWVLRLPAAIFGILTVLGLYLMAKELFGKRTALFASFFLATSFWHINFSRIGFRAIMAPLFLVWSFYALLLAMRKAKNPADEISNAGFLVKPELLFAIAGLLFGAGFHTYLAYRVAPVIALYPLWIFYKNYRAGKLHEKICAPCLILLFIIMAVAAASPLLIYYAKNPADFFGRASGISVFQSTHPLEQFSGNLVKTFQMFFLFGDFNWRHNLAGSPQLWWPIGILFLVGFWQTTKQAAHWMKFAGAGALPRTSDNLKMGNGKEISKFQTRRGEADSFRFMLLWFAVMLLPVAISNEGLPHALRSIVLIPPVIIFSALGFEFIINKISQKLTEAKAKFPESSAQLDRIKKELTVLFFAFLIAGAISAYNDYFIKWAGNFKVYESFQTDLTEKAHWLKYAPSDIKKYVITGETEKVDLTGSPMSLEPIVFITDTLFAARQKEKNIYYIAAKNIRNLDCKDACIILPVETDAKLFRSIKQAFPELRLDVSPGFVAYKK